MVRSKEYERGVCYEEQEIDPEPSDTGGTDLDGGASPV